MALKAGLILLGFIIVASDTAHGKLAHVTCERNFQKIGCFHERNSQVALTDPLINDRDGQGYDINWKEFKESLHSLACRCAEKAKDEGYSFFGIRFFALCYGGKNSSKLHALITNNDHKSNDCAGIDYNDCDHSSEDECAGRANSEYVYEMKKPNQPQDVNGGYTEFSQWTVCSATCGNGTQARERTCMNPKPKGNGKDCVELGLGDSTEIRICKIKECPVNGGYGPWTAYGPCSKSCGDGTETRTRKCNNPLPAHGGTNCTDLGPESEENSCNKQNCSNGKPIVIEYTDNIAKGKPTDQSSLYSNGPSSLAVDGNANTNYHDGSCTQTQKQKDAWWKVDLLDAFEVAKVKITNRGDCCSNRLRSFEVRIGNDDKNPKDNQLCIAVTGPMKAGETKTLTCTSPLEGRYVFIVNSVDEYLTLCEVEVFALKGSQASPMGYTANIARGMQTDQSSMGWNGPSSLAVDGNSNTIYNRKSCTHTRKQKGAWWKVDLRTQFNVAKVTVTNRGDCCWHRLRQFEIRVGNNATNAKDNPVCVSVGAAMKRGETKTLTCISPLEGRYVFIINNVNEYLTLCEVQVFALKGSQADPVQYTDNIALKKPTAQSSIDSNGPSSLAVDGDLTTDYHKQSCTHTKKQKGAWWKVDLRDGFAVAYVKITNRGDCCYERLRNFEIRVGDNSQNPGENQLCTAVVASMGKGETRKFVCKSPLAGRYVFVVNNVAEPLTLCEVQVFALKDWHSNYGDLVEGVTDNIAKGKPTDQSSFGWNGPSSLAVDGNVNTIYNKGSCTHTQKEKGAWWKVDFVNHVDVAVIKITNRGDCCWTRLRNFEVRVGNNGKSPRENKLCTTVTGAMGKGETRQLLCTSPIKGRYMFVINNVNELLTLCEVQVFALKDYERISTNLTGNIAKGKPTDQSSTGWNGPSSRAVDGNTNSIYHKGSCTHTHKQAAAWWKVDLIDQHEVVMVKITNRGDCCSYRLRNFEIRIGNNDKSPKENQLCTVVIGAMGKGETRQLACTSPTKGRYVFIVVLDNEYLTLCEVQVFALQGNSKNEISYTGNLAKGKPTAQSSTGWAGPSSLAVDGNRNTDYFKKSCTHTNKQKGAWWRVDLQKEFPISRVTITNRGDCCWTRLRQFDIRVGNITNDPKANHLCSTVVAGLGKGETRTFVCKESPHPRKGRYVFIINNVNEHLTLCEVQVFAITG